ncbi:MAG: threonine synthase [Alphaproteobacteria bacterium]
MKYISTRGEGAALNFEEVLLTGLAPDGGLYMPQYWPQISLENIRGKSYAETAFIVMAPFVEGCIAPGDFQKIIDETYNDKNFSGGAAPLHALSKNLYVLELFHGPTLAFKDIALQLLGRLFDHVLKKRDEKVTILGATSGDTGSAAIEGCRHSSRVNMFILHPHKRVSDVQRRQMTTVKSDNVHNIAVQGTFDDCQALVKSLFNDIVFRAEMNLSAVNSINWARIMAQIVYYFYAAAQMQNDVTFVVPTGNFGNVFASYAAKQMGLGVKLVIATNCNDILTRFFESGEMKKAGVRATMSPSMDIEISSNFERYLFELLDRDANALKKYMDDFSSTGAFKIDEALLKKAQADFKAFRCTEDQTLATIREISEETDYILDPHSAVGVHAARILLGEEVCPVIALATAHPVKFPDTVEKAIGCLLTSHARLEGLFSREEHFTVLPNDVSGLMRFIRGCTLATGSRLTYLSFPCLK